MFGKVQYFRDREKNLLSQKMYTERVGACQEKIPLYAMVFGFP
jgi:hypothetical protein